jgi:pimeloyl-ACP methyl ester carboxylesterase
MTYAFRTRFGRDIVAEFMEPARPGKRPRVIILCDGMPTVPSKGSLVEFYARKGYWVFHPRYRGTWESGGSFLARPCDEDIGIVVDGLTRGFRDAWSGRQFRLQNPNITLIASSFGGATALLASRDVRVQRVVAFSPVVDWTSESRAEPMSFLKRFTAEGFGMGYRGSSGIWKKLRSGRYFNPTREEGTIDGRKLLLVHARDDDSVLWRPVERFARRTGAELVLLKHGGHMGLRAAMEPRFWKRIARFIKMKP